MGHLRRDGSEILAVVMQSNISITKVFQIGKDVFLVKFVEGV